MKWLGIDVTAGAGAGEAAPSVVPTEVESTAAETEATETAPAE